MAFNNKKSTFENNPEYIILTKYIDEKSKEYIDQFKWLVGIISTIFTVLIVGSFINFSLERNQLETFKENTKKELLGEINEEANIIIKAQDGSRLTGKTIKINNIEKIVRENKDNYYNTPRYKFKYSITLENTGTGLAKNPFVKLYFTEKLSDDVINPNNVEYATDETEYDYENTHSLKNTPLENLPSNVSYSHTFAFNQFGEIKPGIYPFKIKIFYGKTNKISESEFFLEIVDNPKIVEVIKDDTSTTKTTDLH